MSQEIKLRVERLMLHASHGVAPQERRVGNRFAVTVILRYETEAVDTDMLDDTISYAEVVEVARQVMAEPSRLIEHVCGRLQRALMSRWPQIKGGSVTVTKVTPPIAAQLDGCSVTLDW